MRDDAQTAIQIWVDGDGDCVGHVGRKNKQRKTHAQTLCPARIWGRLRFAHTRVKTKRPAGI